VPAAAVIPWRGSVTSLYWAYSMARLFKKLQGKPKKLINLLVKP